MRACWIPGVKAKADMGKDSLTTDVVTAVVLRSREKTKVRLGPSPTRF